MSRSQRPPQILFVEQKSRLNTGTVVAYPRTKRSWQQSAKKITLDLTTTVVYQQNLKFYQVSVSAEKIAESCTAAHDDGGSLQLRRCVPASYPVHPNALNFLAFVLDIALPPLQVDSRRMNSLTEARGHHFPCQTSRFPPCILAQGFSTPLLVDDRATLQLRRIWCVLTRWYAM